MGVGGGGWVGGGGGYYSGVEGGRGGGTVFTPTPGQIREQYLRDNCKQKAVVVW